MRKQHCLALLMLFALAGGAVAEEHDFYRYLRYPAKLVPGVGRNKVEQAGGGDAVGYKRRTVQWWPRQGQDIVDVPKGAPLRVWTRNKGQENKEAQAGVCRNWTASDGETFKAHLIGFKSFGTSTVDPTSGQVLIPAAILRMENGEQRAVVDYGPVSRMLSQEDHDFIQKVWEKAFPKLHATVSDDDLPMPGRPPGGTDPDAALKFWKGGYPKFNGLEPARDGAKYPRWGWRGDELIFETRHYHIIARPKTWGRPANWICPEDVERQDLYRKHVLEYLENFWTYVEAAGASMPYWRRFGPNCKYIIHVHRARAAGGWGHCGIGDCSPHIFAHEFFHGQPLGGWGAEAETMCNAGQHTAMPGELQMFNGGFRYPWRNVFYMGYQSSLWFFVLGDNPNWGYGIQTVAGCLASDAESTAFHTIARLGQKKGLWKNGVKGFGDFFGEYAARMVTCDFVEQYPIRAKYGMPEMSAVYPVYGHENRYRISNAEAPRWCGYNIIRLKAVKGAKEIAADFQGIHDPAQHSDWRACIVAVDGNGRARYSPLWNKGKMAFALKPSDKHLWLTVSASPSAFPVLRSGRRGASYRSMFQTGIHAPRHPWEVTLTGCEPGSPHRRQGDVVNFDELHGRCDSDNTYLNYPVKHEVPIPLAEEDGKLAQEKLAAMLPRIKASGDALKKKVESGLTRKGYFWDKKTMRLGDLASRVKFLQRNARGHRHPNGGGFVADNAHVAASAYVGPNAMVLDGARVKDNACIKGFAVVLGSKTVISGNAKIGGRAWVFGDLAVSGNARILEAATVTTLMRTPRTPSQRFEGQATITGSAVIKGEHFLHLSYATDQTVTGGVVMDYTPTIHNGQAGVFKYGRFHQEHHRRPPSFSGGVDAGALYANWQFNQPKAVLLEDAYVNNNGILYGRPEFADDGEHRCIVFNGKDQYAEAPPSVADFGELTIDMLVNRSGDKGGRLFDFGTGADECFYLAIEGRSGKPTLTARHKGKSCSLAASQGLPADKWARVRVEMDGSAACIYVDEKQVAKGKFEFRPRDVFIGDRPEGNFIARGRSKDEFFKGKMDHFRIYRKVHDDFNSLGPAPFPLTQIQEWSERDQQRSDEWAGRRRAKEAEIRAGRYGQLQDEIKQLNGRRSALYKKTAKIEELEKRSRQAEEAKRALDRKINEKYKVLANTPQAEKEIKELRGKIDGITRRIRESSEYLKFTADIRACEKRRGEMEKEARESPELKAISAKADAAGKEMQAAEERIGQVPELKKVLESSEREKDNRKKRELRDKYNRLFAARKQADLKWQKADVAHRRLGSSYNEAVRNAIDSHAGRKRMEGEIRRLREAQDTLFAKRRKSHPTLARLEESVRAKQSALSAARKQIEDQVRSGGDYKKAEAARVAARKAIDDERKRLEQEKSKDAADLAARIETLQRESSVLWNKALKTAGLSGMNPYPDGSAAGMNDLQRSPAYHTTADWEDRTREEIDGKAPAKMMEWLKRVRGY